MPELAGLAHIDLTVTDPERSARWWQEVMGFRPIRQWRAETFGGWTLRHPEGLTLTVLAHDGQPEDRFDERRVGLDHLSFNVTDLAELERWVAHLATNEVVNSGVIDTGFGPTVVFRDPDNIQLEFYVRPDPAVLRAFADGPDELRIHTDISHAPPPKQAPSV